MHVQIARALMVDRANFLTMTVPESVIEVYTLRYRVNRHLENADVRCNSPNPDVGPLVGNL